MHTLIDRVFFLLTFLSAAGSGVDLVTDATEEATAAAGLFGAGTGAGLLAAAAHS